MSARLTTITLFIVVCTPFVWVQGGDRQARPDGPPVLPYLLMNTVPLPLKVFVPSVAVIT